MASGRGEDNGADELDSEHLPPLFITPETELAQMRRLLDEERAQRVAAMRVASEMFGSFNRLLAESVAQQAATQAALDEANRDNDALRAELGEEKKRSVAASQLAERLFEQFRELGVEVWLE